MPDYLLEGTFYIALLTAAVRIASPLIFASIGETICEHAGVTNIGLEGTMLIGAWAGFMGMFYSGSALVGIAAAILGGVVITSVLVVSIIALDAIALALLGPGAYSIDSYRFGRRVVEQRHRH